MYSRELEELNRQEEQVRSNSHPLLCTDNSNSLLQLQVLHQKHIELITLDHENKRSDIQHHYKVF